jgi:hypothetical protein
VENATGTVHFHFVLSRLDEIRHCLSFDLWFGFSPNSPRPPIDWLTLKSLFVIMRRLLNSCLLYSAAVNSSLAPKVLSCRGIENFGEGVEQELNYPHFPYAAVKDASNVPTMSSDLT